MISTGIQETALLFLLLGGLSLCSVAQAQHDLPPTYDGRAELIVDPPVEYSRSLDLEGCKAPDAGQRVALLDRDGSPAEEARIRPYPENPHYLAWGDTPIFPLGAAGQHSWTPISRPGTVDFEAQMDRLAARIEAVGSPHVRGFVRVLLYDPMNHMHDGPVERVLQPWVRRDNGRYDLERFDSEWEERLEHFLDAALEREIVVSLELWDDWSVTRGPGGQYDPGAGGAWNAHPFNPNNNVNYGRDVLPDTTAACDAPFYRTVPARDHIDPVLALQKRYVDRVLEIAGTYPNILFNLSNESRAHRDWSRFWAEYVRERLPASAMVGDMPSTSRETDDGQCESAFSPQTLSTDRRYDFVDVAQAVSGHSFEGAREQALGGGRRIRSYRTAMAEAGTRKPVVVSKDYTRAAEGGTLVLWGRFVGGAATARFHRVGPDHGEEVIEFQHEAVERLGRFIAEVPFWRMHPAPDRIDGLPASMGANVLAAPEGGVVVQLVGEGDGSAITLTVPPGTWQGEWVNPATGRQIDRFDRQVDDTSLALDPPGDRAHRILWVRRTGE